MTRAEVLTLAGPAGPLETKLEFPDGDEASPRVFGVACHPHPLFGGTMDNKVTHVLARAMMECGAPAFRFNFRGVGASAGSFDNGRGETDDLAAVVAEGRRRFPDAALWLGGFSFGAFVALRGGAAARARRNWWRSRRRWRASISAAWRIRTATGCWPRAMPTTWCHRRRCWHGRPNSHPLLKEDGRACT